MTDSWEIAGLRVRLAALPGAHTIGACLRVGAGSGADPRRPWGTAHLTEHLRIAAVAGSGLHITGRTENAETRFTMAGLAEQSVGIAGTLARILDPRGPAGDAVFEAERAAVVLESRAAAANPLLLLGPAVADAALPSRGLADAARATEETIGSITPAHVDAFTVEHYRPGDSVLTLAGALPDRSALVDAIASALPPPPSLPPPSVPSVPSSGSLALPPPGAARTGRSLLRLPSELDGLLLLTVPVTGPGPFPRSVARALAADLTRAGHPVIGQTTVSAAGHEVIVVCWRDDHPAGDLRAAISGTLRSARRGEPAMVEAWYGSVLRSFQEHAFAAGSPLGRAQLELLEAPLDPGTAPAAYATALPDELRRTANGARRWRVTAGALHPETRPDA